MHFSILSAALFTIISTIIIYRRQYFRMLFKHTPHNLTPRQPLHSHFYQSPQPVNTYKNAMPNRVLMENSPPVKIITQPQRANISPSHQYMMHLVPQQPSIINQSTSYNPGVHVVRSASSSLLNKFSDKKTTPLTQSILTVQKPHVTINNNSSSTGFRSRGNSELSNKMSRLNNTKNQYMIPESPSNLKKMEPIRRVSQHKLNISTSDQQGHQQNIKIIIQTNSMNQPNNTPSKVTIEHVQGQTHNQMNATNGSFVVNSVPQPQKVLVLDNTPKMVVTSQNKLNGSTDLVQNNAVASPTCSQLGNPVVFQQRVQNRGYSYSMDSKHVQRQSQKQNQLMKQKIQVRSNFKSKQQESQPDIIVIDPPSQLSADKKPISFSVQQNSQLLESQTSKKFTSPNNKMKEYYSSQSTPKREKNKLSIESTNANREYRKKIAKQVYNEYYDESDDPQESIIRETPQRLNYMYYDQQKSLFASTLLLNQIYQNEVHKALLKMNVVQNRSRQKSIKRRNY